MASPPLLPWPISAKNSPPTTLAWHLPNSQDGSPLMTKELGKLPPLSLLSSLVPKPRTSLLSPASVPFQKPSESNADLSSTFSHNAPTVNSSVTTHYDAPTPPLAD